MEIKRNPEIYKLIAENKLVDTNYEYYYAADCLKAFLDHSKKFIDIKEQLKELIKELKEIIEKEEEDD